MIAWTPSHKLFFLNFHENDPTPFFCHFDIPWAQEGPVEGPMGGAEIAGKGTGSEGTGATAPGNAGPQKMVSLIDVHRMSLGLFLIIEVYESSLIRMT